MVQRDVRVGVLHLELVVQRLLLPAEEGEEARDVLVALEVRDAEQERGLQGVEPLRPAQVPVSYTHLTLPTNREV